MRQLVIAVAFLALTACATATPEQELVAAEKIFTRIVKQLDHKCGTGDLTPATCRKAKVHVMRTRDAFNLAWSTDATNLDAIQVGLRQLQEIANE